MAKRIKTKEATTADHKPSERVANLLEYFAHKQINDDGIIEITSGTLKDMLFCHYSYEHKVAANTTNSMSCKSQVPVHEDLTAAFRLFNVHLAVICEELNPSEIPDIDNLPALDPDLELNDPRQDSLAVKLSGFIVSSFFIAGNGENEGVVLKGQKRLSTGDYVKLETPVTKFQSEYAFTHELRLAVLSVIDEIEQYVAGKQAPPRQTELDFDSGESTGDVDFE